MFGSILIANRGEIACRVIRSARRMGVRTVAVYSDADAEALHVAMADTALPVGAAPARDSYLNTDRILEAARRAGAEAIHPGYGFLSENADFAEACAAAGVVFIGPPPAAIRAMGSKSAAKALMAQAGVPLVPGYHGAEQDPAHLAAEAGRIGYPVLIKASAGGGGKGMRVVTDPDGFLEGLALAKGEAASSFGDDTVLVERYLTQPRHIEIQVFADSLGAVVSLFERDCSIQRRHQKVVEEAPAPGLGEARRADMGRAACAAARAIGYVGAGTVEFIVENDAFFFMEMNTRLQVEHPVTEMITGLDLVEWQLRVASGERLPSLEPEITGHAIEMRVYAEDAGRDFMPSTGRILHLRTPEQGRHVRVDTGVRAGDAVQVHYDPMLAKLIVWDTDRGGAVRYLRRALAEYEAVGVQTNLDLLRAIAAHPAFAAAELDTGFIARHGAALLAPRGPAPDLALAAAALRVLQDRADAAVRQAGADPYSPWTLATAWRMNGDGYQDLMLRDGDLVHSVRAHPRPDGGARLDLPGGAVDVGAVDVVAVDVGAGADAVMLDGTRHRVTVVRDGDTLTAVIGGVNWPLVLIDPLAPAAGQDAGGDRVVAPMPGRVIQVAAHEGQTVRRGDVLLVLEAMKVQMRLTAPRDGVLGAVRVAVGDLVEDGAELVGYAPE